VLGAFARYLEHHCIQLRALGIKHIDAFLPEKLSARLIDGFMSSLSLAFTWIFAVPVR
jgi:hypothetical protein